MPDETHDAVRSPTLALTRVGPFDVALAASALRLFLHDDPDVDPSAPSDCVDVARRLGVPEQHGREVLVQTAHGGLRVRLGREVRFEHQAPDPMPLPPLCAPLLERLGVVGLVSLSTIDHGDAGYALLVDVDALAQRSSA